MRKLGMMIAMEGEAAGLIRELALAPCELPQTLSRYPFRWFEGRRGRLAIRLAVSGRDRRHDIDHIGLEAAAVGAFALVQDFLPDLVVNCGTAGSFARLGAEVGKVFLSGDRFYFHDHRIPLGAFEPYGRGAIPAADTKRLASELSLPIGIVSSGSSLDYVDRDLAVFLENGATLKEMEATAIAKICDWAGVPFFAVKSVTNLIDSGRPSPTEFTRNFERAVASLTTETIRVLDRLAAGFAL